VSKQLLEAKTAWYCQPWIVVPLYLLLTSAALPFAAKVETDLSTQRLVPGSDPDLAFNREMVSEFGGDELVVIVLEAPDVFLPPILQAVEDMTIELESAPAVTRVVSLSTVFKLEGEGDSLDTNLLMGTVPDNPEDLAALKDIALTDPLFLRELVGKEGNATAINVFLDPELLAAEDYRTIIDRVDQAVSKVEKTLPDEVDIYVTGTPELTKAIRTSLKRDLIRWVPLAAALIVIVLLVAFRSFVFALIPVVTGCVAIIPLVALMYLFGFGLDPITASVPLLILAIGLLEDTHLLNEYRLYRRRGLSRNRAINYMFEHAGTGVLLTSLTIALGFATLAFSGIPALKDLGIVTGAGIALNFLVTIHFLPAVLRALPETHSSRSEGSGDPEPKDTVMAVVRFTRQVPIRHRRVVIASGILGSVLLFPGVLQLRLDPSMQDMLPLESEVRSNFTRLSESLSGGHFFRVIVEAPGPNDMLRPEYLRELDAIDQYLASRFDKTLSYAQFMRKLHLEMNHGEPVYDRIPEEADLIAQYALLLNRDEIARVLDFDQRRASIIVRSSDGSVSFLAEEAAALEQFLEKEISPLLDVRMSGSLLQGVHSSERISRVIRIAAGVMLVGIVVMVSLLFMSLKAGLLSLMPIVFPLLTVLGIMGWYGLPLSILTCSVVVIGLGIAVAETIHLLSRYHQKLRVSDTPEKAMEDTIGSEFLPIASATAALSAAFLILSASSSGSTTVLGFLAAATILAAFLGNLLIAPSLLLRTPIASSWVFFRMKFNVEQAMLRGLFRGMQSSDVKRLAVMAQVIDYKEGETVLKKGDRSKDLYWIIEGKVGVYLETTEESAPITHYQAGDVIGEMAFLMDEPRSATIVAEGPLRLMRIDDSTLKRVMGKFPATAAKIYQNISYTLVQRLKQRTQKLTELRGAQAQAPEAPQAPGELP
jgi:predicted RND superfamily exporter protein